MPAGFAGRRRAAGIKASGGPDLAIVVADGGPGRGGRGLHPERVRGGAGPAVPGAPRRRPSRPAAAGYGWARAIVSTSGCANAATGPAGDADQAEVAAVLAEALRVPADADPAALDRAHRHAAAAGQGRGRDPDGDRRRSPATDDALEAVGRRAPDDRLADEARDGDASSCPDPTGRRSRSRSAASPRASG